MVVICSPKCQLKKSDQEIISFIKEITKGDDHACVVVAHADYNPLDLKALYVLDCEVGDEEKCFASVLKLWSECRELFFLKMKIDDVMEKVIVSHPVPPREKRSFIRKILDFI